MCIATVVDGAVAVTYHSEVIPLPTLSVGAMRGGILDRRPSSIMAAADASHSRDLVLRRPVPLASPHSPLHKAARRLWTRPRLLRHGPGQGEGAAGAWTPSRPAPSPESPRARGSVCWSSSDDMTVAVGGSCRRRSQRSIVACLQVSRCESRFRAPSSSESSLMQGGDFTHRPLRTPCTCMSGSSRLSTF